MPSDQLKQERHHMFSVQKQIEDLNGQIGRLKSKLVKLKKIQNFYKTQLSKTVFVGLGKKERKDLRDLLEDIVTKGVNKGIDEQRRAVLSERKKYKDEYSKLTIEARSRGISKLSSNGKELSEIKKQIELLDEKIKRLKDAESKIDDYVYYRELSVANKERITKTNNAIDKHKQQIKEYRETLEKHKKKEKELRDALQKKKELEEKKKGELLIDVAKKAKDKYYLANKKHGEYKKQREDKDKEKKGKLVLEKKQELTKRRNEVEKYNRLIELNKKIDEGKEPEKKDVKRQELAIKAPPKSKKEMDEIIKQIEARRQDRKSAEAKRRLEREVAIQRPVKVPVKPIKPGVKPLRAPVALQEPSEERTSLHPTLNMNNSIKSPESESIASYALSSPALPRILSLEKSFVESLSCSLKSVDLSSSTVTPQ